MGPKYCYECPYTKEGEGDLIYTQRRRQCGDRGDIGVTEPTSEGTPRNVSSHRKIEEAGDGFSPRASAGSTAPLTP